MYIIVFKFILAYDYVDCEKGKRLNDYYLIRRDDAMRFLNKNNGHHNISLGAYFVGIFDGTMKRDRDMKGREV